MQTMKKYKLAVLGCGSIFSRHLTAINLNPQHYELVGLYDININAIKKHEIPLSVKIYNCEDEAYLDENVNCIVILTPSNLHYPMAMKSLNNNKHVIIEKPATFYCDQLEHIIKLADQKKLNVFGVLQVRLNPSVIVVKSVIEKGLLGNIRSVSLTQRWQRPQSYFVGWRGAMETGGGILREFSIHYLDILQYLMGVPKVLYASFYNTKFKNINVSDTIYSLFDFGNYGGIFEVSIAAEPKNIECSLSILSDNGYIKLGGKSLDEIVASDFLDDEIQQNFLSIQKSIVEKKSSLLALSGASPYHPELYKLLIDSPSLFHLNQTYNVINLIENIYEYKDKQI